MNKKIGKKVILFLEKINDTITKTCDKLFMPIVWTGAVGSFLCFLLCTAMCFYQNAVKSLSLNMPKYAFLFFLSMLAYTVLIAFGHFLSKTGKKQNIKHNSKS